MQQNEPASQLVDVHFVSSEKGWAVAKDGAVLHTEDGGKTWDAQAHTKLRDWPRDVHLETISNWGLDIFRERGSTTESLGVTTL